MEKDFVFAERLKKCRKEKGYTQDQLAKITNISVQTIRNYEQDLNEPIARYLLEMAKALDVTPEYLLIGENNMNNYTAAIKAELMQLADYDKIVEIKNAELNSTVLDHLEMSEELVMNTLMIGIQKISLSVLIRQLICLKIAIALATMSKK